MGIARMEGTVNGTLVIFYRRGCHWEIVIPNDLQRGKYVVEVAAYDKAGNLGYSATMLLTLDMLGIKAAVVSLHFALDHNGSYCMAFGFIVLAPTGYKQVPDAYIPRLPGDKCRSKL